MSNALVGQSSFDDWNELVPTGNVSLRIGQHLAPVPTSNKGLDITAEFYVADHLPSATDETRNHDSQRQRHALYTNNRQHLLVVTNLILITPTNYYFLKK